MNITLEMVDDEISTVKFPKNIKVEIKTADASCERSNCIIFI